MRSRGSAPGGSLRCGFAPQRQSPGLAWRWVTPYRGWYYATNGCFSQWLVWAAKPGLAGSSGPLDSFLDFPLATAVEPSYITNMYKPAPLPAQPLAALLADLRAQADHQAARFGPLAALHALILSTLARLLTGLEQIFEQWRAGILPIPAPRDIPRPHNQAADGASPPKLTDRSCHRAPSRAPGPIRPARALPARQDPGCLPPMPPSVLRNPAIPRHASGHFSCASDPVPPILCLRLAAHRPAFAMALSFFPPPPPLPPHVQIVLIS